MKQYKLDPLIFIGEKVIFISYIDEFDFWEIDKKCI